MNKNVFKVIVHAKINSEFEWIDKKMRESNWEEAVEYFILSQTDEEARIVAISKTLNNLKRFKKVEIKYCEIEFICAIDAEFEVI